MTHKVNREASRFDIILDDPRADTFCIVMGYSKSEDPRELRRQLGLLGKIQGLISPHGEDQPAYFIAPFFRNPSTAEGNRQLVTLGCQDCLEEIKTIVASGDKNPKLSISELGNKLYALNVLLLEMVTASPHIAEVLFPTSKDLLNLSLQKAVDIGFVQLVAGVVSSLEGGLPWSDTQQEFWVGLLQSPSPLPYMAFNTILRRNPQSSVLENTLPRLVTSGVADHFRGLSLFLMDVWETKGAECINQAFEQVADKPALIAELKKSRFTQPLLDLLGEFSETAIASPIRERDTSEREQRLEEQWLRIKGILNGEIEISLPFGDEPSDALALVFERLSAEAVNYIGHRILEHFRDIISSEKPLSKCEHALLRLLDPLLIATDFKDGKLIITIKDPTLQAEFIDFFGNSLSPTEFERRPFEEIESLALSACEIGVTNRDIWHSYYRTYADQEELRADLTISCMNFASENEAEWFFELLETIPSDDRQKHLFTYISVLARRHSPEVLGRLMTEFAISNPDMDWPVIAYALQNTNIIIGGQRVIPKVDLEDFDM